MRGKALRGVTQQVQRGITPAYAGKRREGMVYDRYGRDHPRVCGEKRQSHTPIPEWLGSPPRMRGKEILRLTCTPATGITPAYAGKRPHSQLADAVPRDHPRVCGEKHPFDAQHQCNPGSPPRMRGKVIRIPAKTLKARITPAYAGKRKITSFQFCASRDHPRVCGEKTKKIP